MNRTSAGSSRSPTVHRLGDSSDDRERQGSGPSLVFQLVHLRKKLTSGTVPTPFPQLSSHAVQDGLFTGLPVRPQGSETAFRRFFQVGRVDPVGLGFADNFFDQIQVPVDVPPDDGVHVGWRFLSLPPPQFFYTQGRKPARLGGGAGGTTAILCLRETCARWHGARAANGPVPQAREAANAPPKQRRGALVEVVARRLFCKSR